MCAGYGDGGIIPVPAVIAANEKVFNSGLKPADGSVCQAKSHNLPRDCVTRIGSVTTGPRNLSPRGILRSDIALWAWFWLIIPTSYFPAFSPRQLRYGNAITDGSPIYRVACAELRSASVSVTTVY